MRQTVGIVDEARAKPGVAAKLENPLVVAGDIFFFCADKQFSSEVGNSDFVFLLSGCLSDIATTTLTDAMRFTKNSFASDAGALLEARDRLSAARLQRARRRALRSARAVAAARYLFNPWSNGERVMSTATKGTVAYRRMQTLAKTDPEIAARLKHFDCRTLEELYDYRTDPDALHNLIDDPKHRAERERLTGALEAWMIRTRDPMLDVFRQRYDLSVRETYMAQMAKEAESHKALRVGDADDPAPAGPKKKTKRTPPAAK